MGFKWKSLLTGLSDRVEKGPFPQWRFTGCLDRRLGCCGLVGWIGGGVSLRLTDRGRGPLRGKKGDGRELVPGHETVLDSDEKVLMSRGLDEARGDGEADCLGFFWKGEGRHT